MNNINVGRLIILTEFRSEAEPLQDDSQLSKDQFVLLRQQQTRTLR